MGRNGEAHGAFYSARDHGGPDQHAHPLMENLVKTMDERALTELKGKALERHVRMVKGDIETQGGFGVPKAAWDPQSGYLSNPREPYDPKER